MNPRHFTLSTTETIDGDPRKGTDKILLVDYTSVLVLSRSSTPLDINLS